MNWTKKMRKVLNIDVRPIEETQKLMLSFARGDLGKIWPASKLSMPNMEVVSQYLSKENVELLKIIRKQKPSTMSQLAALSNRQEEDLSITLSKMAACGLVQIDKNDANKMPKVDYQTIRINLNI